MTTQMHLLLAAAALFSAACRDEPPPPVTWPANGDMPSAAPEALVAGVPSDAREAARRAAAEYLRFLLLAEEAPATRQHDFDALRARLRAAPAARRRVILERSALVAGLRHLEPLSERLAVRRAALDLPIETWALDENWAQTFRDAPLLSREQVDTEAGAAAEELESLVARYEDALSESLPCRIEAETAIAVTRTQLWNARGKREGTTLALYELLRAHDVPTELIRHQAVVAEWHPCDEP